MKSEGRGNDVARVQMHTGSSQSIRPATTDNNLYIGTDQNMTSLAGKYGIDPASFILFWKSRFPEHGPAYMEDWARRIKYREANNNADSTTLHVLNKCNLGDGRV